MSAEFIPRTGALLVLLVWLAAPVLSARAEPPSPGHSAPHVSGSSGRPQSTESIPAEPEEYDDREVNAYYDWRNDLFFRKFDLSGTGRTDFMTARRTYKVWTNDFGHPVVLTMANPLFYWVDVNANGEFESHQGEMWSDPEEDGVNGNETPYDVHDLRGAGPPAYPFDRD